MLILTMPACGTVLRKSLVCSIRGSTRSSAYFNSPMHFALASTLMKGFPTTRKSFRLPPLFPAINRLPGRFRLLAADTRSRQLHRFQYFDIARAAAEVPGEGFLDFVSRRVGSVFEKRFRSEKDSRRAISTLSSAEFGKGLLQRMKFGSHCHALNRGDLMAFHSNSESQARKYWTAIHQYGAAPAFTQLAAVLRAGQTQILAKHFQERLVRRKRDFHLFPIDSQHQVRLLERVLCPLPNLFHYVASCGHHMAARLKRSSVKAKGGKEPQEAEKAQERESFLRLLCFLSAGPKPLLKSYFSTGFLSCAAFFAAGYVA